MKAMASQNIIIIYALAATLIIQVSLIIRGHSMLVEQTQEKVEFTISIYAGLLSWVFLALLVLLWSALGREPWYKASPFHYFYQLFGRLPDILPGFSFAHILVFLCFGIAFSLFNLIITSYLCRTFVHARMKRIS
ncbi:MAG: hypothetical protein RDV48_13405 [Candidatus Eremiobacteraeota bacterium]|nr:hypothetical protein [Candidatus Eremiobacteraeota bacterium]